MRFRVGGTEPRVYSRPSASMSASASHSASLETALSRHLRAVLCATLYASRGYIGLSSAQKVLVAWPVSLAVRVASQVLQRRAVCSLVCSCVGACALTAEPADACSDPGQVQ